MPASSYDNPDFAREYAMAQVDPRRNRYEWAVTQPSLLQFLDSDTKRIIDYGCGTGIFTAGMNSIGQANLNPGLESVGVDASPAMLHYAHMIGKKTTGVYFQEWDAARHDSILQDGTADRVFAKLVFNYVSPDDLHAQVMPRLRECLNDEGLLIAVLPNPLREVGYSNSKYDSVETLDINVGNFGPESGTKSYRHTYEDVLRAANHAGFAYGSLSVLPSVRFEPYKKWPWSTEKLMKIAHPAPLIYDTFNSAKRWVYIFGAAEKSAEIFDTTVSRFENWRDFQFPEIADRAHIIVPNEHVDDDIDLVFESDRKQAIYEYTSDPESGNGSVVTLDGLYAENLSPRQKLKLAHLLAKNGIRQTGVAADYLIND